MTAARPIRVRPRQALRKRKADWRCVGHDPCRYVLASHRYSLNIITHCAMRLGSGGGDSAADRAARANRPDVRNSWPGTALNQNQIRAGSIMPRGRSRSWPTSDRSYVYRPIEDWSGCPKASWTVQRLARGHAPVRLPFRGTREEAEAEAAKLNALAGLTRAEAPEIPPLAPRTGAWTGPEAVHPWTAGRAK